MRFSSFLDTAATIDFKIDAGDEVGLVAAQIRTCVGHVAWRAASSDGHSRNEGLHVVRSVVLANELGSPKMN